MVSDASFWILELRNRIPVYPTAQARKCTHLCEHPKCVPSLAAALVVDRKVREAQVGDGVRLADVLADPLPVHCEGEIRVEEEGWRLALDIFGHYVDKADV